MCIPNKIPMKVDKEKLEKLKDDHKISHAQHVELMKVGKITVSDGTALLLTDISTPA